MNLLPSKFTLALLIFSTAVFTNSARCEIIVLDNFNVDTPVLLVNYNTAFDIESKIDAANKQLERQREP